MIATPSSPLLFGIETEYATSFVGVNGDSDPRASTACHDIVRTVGQLVSHVEGNGSGDIFLCNGSRCYPDAGGHVELCTAECTDPGDLVASAFAGDQLLHEATCRLATDRPGVIAILGKGNVDYTWGTSWGSHENYLMTGARFPEDLASDLAGHLVSRIVFSGSGGFRTRWLSAEFTTSPRSWRLTRVVSSNTQSCRGLINTKDEPLGDKGHRLHLICGDSLCSHLGLYLRIGSTALIVALLDRGIAPKKTIRLRQPLAALRLYASDPTLTVTAPDDSGQPLTAIALQRRYLDFVASNFRALPGWAPDLAASWTNTLDTLERDGPHGATLSLDWGIKYSLYGRLLAAAGFSWESFRDLGRTLTRGLFEYRTTHEPNKAHDWRSAEGFRNVASWMAHRGICSEERARAHFAIRLQLLEADTRFSQLGNGTFAQLDRKGLLRHSAPGVTAARIGRARKSPPKGSRARARGLMIRRLARGAPPLGHRAMWNGIVDMLQHRVFDLSDNFARWGQWHAAKNGETTRSRLVERIFGGDSAAQRMSYLVNQALGQYDRGDYESAHRVLDSIPPGGRSGAGNAQFSEFLRVSAWVNARRGDTREAFASLAELDRRSPPSLGRACDHTCACRYLGLRPHRDIGPAIAEGMRHLRTSRGMRAGTEVPFLGHVAYDLLKRGQPKRALTVLKMATDQNRIGLAHPHTASRAYAELAEAHRALGNRDLAWENVTRAKQIHEENGYRGDLADFSLTYLAKLQTDPSSAVTLLERARDLQVSLHNEMGEARTVALLARLKADHREAVALRERLLEIQSRREALRECPMVGKLLANWDAWVDGAPDPEPEGSPDDFWCV